MEQFTLLHKKCGKEGKLLFREKEYWHYDGENELPVYVNELMLSCDNCDEHVEIESKKE